MVTTNQGISNQAGSRLVDASAAIRQERTELFDLGRQRSLTKGSLDPNAGDVQSLEDHAKAVVLAHNRDPFDATKYAHDRELEDRFEVNKEANVRQSEAVALSRARVRELGNELAALGNPGPKPTPSIFGLMIAALLLTVTFAPTLHDTVFFGLLETTNWLSSIFFGLIFGVFLAWSIVFTYHLCGKRSSMGWLGLIGGIILICGFLTFRMEVATSQTEQLMAVGFAIVEIGAIVTLEWIGLHLRLNCAEWHTRVDDVDRKTRELNAAEGELKRRLDQLQVLSATIQEHIALVEERWIRHTIPSDLEMAAVKAVHDGYILGIAENQGRVKSA